MKGNIDVCIRGKNAAVLRDGNRSGLSRVEQLPAHQ
jgi:hypothetical protein